MNLETYVDMIESLKLEILSNGILTWYYQLFVKATNIESCGFSGQIQIFGVKDCGNRLG